MAPPPALSHNWSMTFDPTIYGPAIASLLALDSNGQRLIPLVQSSPSHAEAKAQIDSLHAPPPVRAGLYLYFSLWSQAHETAQDINSPEGAYWHAIVHRQEPDASNSGYWFRQVGEHPIFPALRDQAVSLGVDLGPRWSPTRFIEFCEQARQQPGSDAERRALEVQRAEWQLLFDYCNSHSR
ncbi:MAG TPA: hypothetical protein VHW24_17545 [Bryobacteraceae bacterium]|nr:hypothetical protein [Bryobacteraceae bacterium]